MIAICFPKGQEKHPSDRSLFPICELTSLGDLAIQLKTFANYCPSSWAVGRSGASKQVRSVAIKDLVCAEYRPEYRSSTGV